MVNNDRSASPAGLEARVARLEASMEFVVIMLRELKDEVRQLRTDARNDFRILFAVNISATLGLAGVLAKGFGWI